MAEPAYAFHDEDTLASWPEQGSWTWEDYLRLPEDGQRYEIIHGVLYVSPAPRYLHQYVVGRLVHLLSAFVHGRRLGAVLPAPMDVLLPGVASPVQPDVVFLAKKNLPGEEAQSFEGVPDLVVEVLSPGTARVDQKVKLEAYAEAGVPECWIVDPDQRTVVVHGLGDVRGGYRTLGSFQGDEGVRSVALEGLRLTVSELFP